MKNYQDVEEYIQNQLSKDENVKAIFGSQTLSELIKQSVNQEVHNFIMKEREIHQSNHPESIANGFAPSRKLSLGTFPIEINRPRTRDDFYPSILPKYQRVISDEYRDLVYSIVLGAKNFNSIRSSLKALNLPYSKEEVDEILREIYEEAEEYASRPLDADWLFLFGDVKQIHIKDEHGKVKKGSHVLIAGVSLEAKKEILCHKVFYKNETKEVWREVFLDLKNRGVTT